MRKFLDLESAFYAPLWIRVTVTVVLVLWAVFELSQGAYIWALIFLAVGAVCGWRFATIDYSSKPDT
ncbi:hypothetical protein [Planktotalea sp.]|uniref:hypothetical protein n=1 Tax=Planktotalea sp. TaxID=2029877 RepID=UPI003F6C704E